MYLYIRASLSLPVTPSLSISIRLRISFAPTAIYLDRSFIANVKKEEKWQPGKPLRGKDFRRNTSIQREEKEAHPRRRDYRENV